MKKLTLLLCFLVALPFFAQSLGYNNHRIAISADGNKQADNHAEARWPRADPDDWAGTPAALAMIAKAALQDKLVHFSYNNFIGAPPHTTETNHMKNSVDGAIQRWNFDSSRFFDASADHAVAITHLANELKKSTASDPLYFIHMGPAEFFYLAVKQTIDAGNLEALSHVYVISHSGYNDDHLRRFAHHTMAQTIALSGDRIQYTKIQDQNACDNPALKWCSNDNFTPYHWMRNSADESMRWLYTRMQIPGGKEADISDAGMVWYLLKGDEVGNPAKLATFIGDGINTLTTEGCVDYSFNGIQDFEIATVAGFVPHYKDTGRNAIGVNAGMYKDQVAATQKTFEGNSGTYDITITSLTEEDGESTYTVKVNGSLVGSFQNPEVEASGDMQPHTHTFSNVSIKKGDVLQIESNTHTNGKIPEGTGTAWARGRWRSIDFKCLGVESDTKTCTVEEVNGLLVFEAERFELKGAWKLGTDATKASGGKYIYFDGANSYGSVNPSNNISYTFKINSPGTYTFKWMMRQPEGERGSDLGNDAWFYFSDDIGKGRDKDKNDIVLGQFYKFVGRSTDDFTLNGAVEVNHAQSWVRAIFPAAGEYTLNLSGRSHGFQLDRLILYKGIAFDDLPAELAKTAETENCSDATPTAITLSPSPLEVRVGITESLSPSFLPLNANPTVTWASSNESIATVDANGNVTGVQEGSATITATSTVDNSIVGTATANVIAFFAIPVTGITVTPETSTVFVGNTKKVTATISPADADNQNYSWSSSNESIATVNANGTVTAIANGTVTITATTAEGNFTDAAVITVDVFTAPSISFDDPNTYKTTTYYENGELIVNAEFHAGSGNTVLSDNNKGVRFWLRELDSGWKVKKDYIANDASVIGQQSGTATASIPLDGAIPTDELPTGNFYWLWINFYSSGDSTKRVATQVKDIIILDESLSVRTIDIQHKINFTPNPVKDILHLTDNSLNGKEAFIYNTNGKIVLTETIGNNAQIDISKLSSGMYLLHVDKGLAKFIKE
ncbi:Ig-like domain-containing protein [Wenyingzhuangia sp. IMCC45574]